MKLTAPKNVTFWVAVVIVLLGVLAFMGVIPGYGGYAFGLVVIGFIVLALGNLLKGM